MPKVGPVLAVFHGPSIHSNLSQMKENATGKLFKASNPHIVIKSCGRNQSLISYKEKME